MALTLKQAKNRGFDVITGDKVINIKAETNKWYVVDKNSTIVEAVKVGNNGFITQEEALEWLTSALDYINTIMDN